jgi:membrane protein DedA with SNARE-associated domain
MVTLGTITALMAKYGLAVVAPIAVVEGPIVTVIAAWLASQGLMSLWAVAAVVIAADLVGDFGFYAAGRWGLTRLPQGLRRRIGLSRDRLQSLTGHFTQHGGRTLLLGKITHSAGFAVLAAAGMAKMPLGRFFWFNLLGTVPKSLFFVGLGYGFGSAYASIDDWITKVSLGLGVIIVVLVAGLIIRRAVRP